jgi:hypothetical protein
MPAAGLGACVMHDSCPFLTCHHRGIQRGEWQVLLDFFQAKRLRIERLREAQAGPLSGGARAAIDFGDGDDGR